MPDVIDLGYQPRDWQLKYHKNRKRFSVLVCHRRSGKTFLALMQLVDSGLRCEKQDGRFAYIAPLFIQAKATAWMYLKRFIEKIPGVRINESECWIELPNKARIRIYGADNPDALRGLYLDGVVLDEVAQMRADTWGEVVRPALADRLGWALFLGTPKGANLFSEIYQRAVSDPAWFAARFTYEDTQAIPAEEIEQMRREMSDNQFRQEMLCDFTAATENALIPVDLVDAARRRLAPIGSTEAAPKIIGVDVARYGDDRTVILRRQGIHVPQPIILRGADSMLVASRLAEEIDVWHPDAVFIDGSGGYGAGVIDRLRQLNHRVTEVQFGGKPNDPRYSNKRTEMWFLMAEWMATGTLPDMAEWSVDLCSPLYSYANAAGKMALESKDEIKKRGLPSPDLGDALALTFAMPVRSKALAGLGVSRRAQGVDYNPVG